MDKILVKSTEGMKYVPIEEARRIAEFINQSGESAKVELWKCEERPIPKGLSAQSEKKYKHCAECNGVLTQCGELNNDGEPTLDCEVCQLRERIADLEKQLSGMVGEWFTRAEMEAFAKQAYLQVSKSHFPEHSDAKLEEFIDDWLSKEVLKLNAENDMLTKLVHPCPFCGIYPRSQYADTGVKVYEHPNNDCPLSLFPMKLEDWNRRTPADEKRNVYADDVVVHKSCDK